MEQVVKELNELFAEFSKDVSSQVENSNKAAGGRTRKTSLAIEKVLKVFRKTSYIFR